VLQPFHALRDHDNEVRMNPTAPFKVPSIAAAAAPLKRTRYYLKHAMPPNS
jgi:hypothetical protein